MNTNANTRKIRRQRKMKGGFTNTRSNNNDNKNNDNNNDNNNTDMERSEAEGAGERGNSVDVSRMSLKEPHQGPFGYAANLAKGAVTGAASKAAGFIANKLGYAKIGQVSQQLPESSLISSVVSGVGKKINQVGVVLVDSLNESVENSGITETVPQAIGKTFDIAKDVLEKTSEKLEDPQFQEDLKNIADKASIVLDAADKPLNKLVDKAGEIGEKLGEKIASSTVKIGLDTAGMIPGIGEVIEAVRVVDDVAKAGFAIVDAGTQSIKMTADTVSETLHAIQEKIDQAENVLNRTTGSVTDFVDTDNIVKIPQALQRGGGGRKNNNSKRYKYTTRYLTRRRQRQRQR